MSFDSTNPNKISPRKPKHLYISYTLSIISDTMLITKTRKWGNSLGVRIPKDAVRELKLRENQYVVIDIKPKENPLKELFGAVKLSKPTEQLLKEIREKESKYI